MNETKDWFVRAESGEVYGPATLESLVVWAREGRIEPTGFASRDRKSWTPLQLIPELEMKWLVETEPGRVFGPFNREVVIRLFKEGSVPEGAKAYRLHELPVDEDPPPKIVEKVVEKIVEKVVEKIVEVEPPARTELVVPEVVEPVDKAPPVKSPGSIFRGMDREKLVALESAARRELSMGRHLGLAAGIFGRKK